MKLFKDREAAGQLLAEKLKDVKANLVLGIPRGGVVVAKEISDKLGLPLDVVVTRKIGAPNQPELALGAIDADGEVVWDNEVHNGMHLTNTEIDDILENEKQEIKRREALYRKDKETFSTSRPPLDVAGKDVILVDDGMATGSTVLAAVSYLIRHGAAKVILALPVASKESLEKVGHEVDEKVVLETPEQLGSVGQFFQNFDPVLDEEVIRLLQ